MGLVPGVQGAAGFGSQRKQLLSGAAAVLTQQALHGLLPGQQGGLLPLRLLHLGQVELCLQHAPARVGAVCVAALSSARMSLSCTAPCSGPAGCCTAAVRAPGAALAGGLFNRDAHLDHSVLQSPARALQVLQRP